MGASCSIGWFSAGTYRASQAATKPKLYPSGAPLGDAIVRGEVLPGAVILNAVYASRKDGVPVARGQAGVNGACGTVSLQRMPPRSPIVRFP